jgi:PAS domain S-box-containing protein
MQSLPIPNKDARPIKILVADDEEVLRELYLETLCPREDGPSPSTEMQQLEKVLFDKDASEKPTQPFEVVTCRQGEEAVQAVKIAIADAAPFAMALLDVRMPPGINGIQAAEQIRALDPQIEIVIVTGYSDVDPKDLASRIPPIHKFFYFQKPLLPREIIQFARALGTKWSVEQELHAMKAKLEDLVAIRSRALLAVNEKLTADIQKREIAEQALENSEKRYRMLFEKAGDAIFILDASEENPGRIIDANRAAAEMHGYTRDELLQCHIKDLDAPEDAKKISDKIQAILSGQWIKSEIYHVRKDGSTFPVEISAGLVDLEPHQYILAFDRDITERRELEKRLRRSEKMEAIGTLAGGVAHDLNNILSGIVSYPELILMDLPETSDLIKPIRTIKKSGEKAAAIVNDLLTLARRGVVCTEVFDLNQSIGSYLESPEFAKMKSFHPRVDFQTLLEPELAPISGSTVQISKTIMNLMTNAAEAINSSGSVRIATENLSVSTKPHATARIPEGDYAVLKVSDSGIGIASEDIDRIFEPFYTKKAMGRSGTGLGMAVVWGTVQDHNGFIDVESIQGRGTTIKLYFPITLQKPASARSKSSAGDYTGHGESILVIDDVAEQREILTRMLTRLNYTPVAVSSGEQAIAYLKHNKVALLVLDMLMDPGMDGLETYKAILRIHPGQKAVIASGYAETVRFREAEQLGAGAYIKKPYSMEKLGLTISNELKKPTGSGLACSESFSNN